MVPLRSTSPLLLYLPLPVSMLTFSPLLSASLTSSLSSQMSSLPMDSWPRHQIHNHLQEAQSHNWPLQDQVSWAPTLCLWMFAPAEALPQHLCLSSALRQTCSPNFSGYVKLLQEVSPRSSWRPGPSHRCSQGPWQVFNLCQGSPRLCSSARASYC